MDLKKSPKADLENKKGIFTQIGFIFILLTILIAFEWGSRSGNENVFGDDKAVVIEDEMIPITEQKPPEPPPAPEPPKVTEQIEIVEDDVELESDLDINAEDDKREVEIIKFEEKEEKEEVEEEIFVIVEDQPAYPGGTQELMKFLAGAVYPDIARDNGLEGTVYVQFIVEKTGKVTGVKILRGVDPLLDESAMNRVKQMPAWKPGMQRGKPVRVYYRVPISFKLSS